MSKTKVHVETLSGLNPQITHCYPTICLLTNWLQNTYLQTRPHVMVVECWEDWGIVIGHHEAGTVQSLCLVHQHIATFVVCIVGHHYTTLWVVGRTGGRERERYKLKSTARCIFLSGDPFSWTTTAFMVSHLFISACATISYSVWPFVLPHLQQYGIGL